MRYILMFFTLLVLWLLSNVNHTAVLSESWLPVPWFFEPSYHTIASKIILFPMILSIYVGYLKSIKVEGKESVVPDILLLTLSLFIFICMFLVVWIVPFIFDRYIGIHGTIDDTTLFILHFVSYFILLTFLLYKIRARKRLFYLILYGNCSLIICLSLFLYDTIKSYIG